MQNTTDEGGEGTSLTLDAVFICLSLVGVLGNALVLVVLASVKELRTIPNLLIANQSFLDLVASALSCIPDLPVRRGEPIRSLLICIFLRRYGIFWFAMTGSTYNLVMITLERYCAVVHPIRYRMHASFKRAGFAACVPWLIGLLSMTPHIATFVDANGDCNSTASPVSIAIIRIVYFMAQYIIPLVCMIFAYIRIFVSIRTKVGSEPVRPSQTASHTVSGTQESTMTSVSPTIHAPGEPSSSGILVEDSGQQRNTVSMVSRTGPPGGSVATVNDRGNHGNNSDTARGRGRAPSPPDGSVATVNDRGNHGNNSDAARGRGRAPAQPSYKDRARKNIIVTLLIVSLTFFVCWTPNQILFTMSMFGRPDIRGGTALEVSVILAFCNICVNPFIYTFKYRDFRKGLKKMYMNFMNGLRDALHSLGR